MPNGEEFQTESEMPDNPRTQEDKVEADGIGKLRDRLKEKGILKGKIDPSLDDVKHEMRKCAHDTCKNVTNRPSGFCSACEKKLGPYLNTEILRCANCMARGTCPEGKNKWGICVFELNIEKSQMKQKDKIEEEMRDILHRDKKIVERLSRILPSFNLNNAVDRKDFMQMSKDLKLWQHEFMEHLKIFATFKGWTQADRQDMEIMKLRLKALDKVFGRGVKRKSMRQDANVKSLSDDELSPLYISVPTEGMAKSHPGIAPEPDLDLSYLKDSDAVDEKELEIRIADTELNNDMLALEKAKDEFEQKKEEMAKRYDLSWTPDSQTSSPTSDALVEKSSTKGRKGRGPT